MHKKGKSLSMVFQYTDESRILRRFPFECYLWGNGEIR